MICDYYNYAGINRPVTLFATPKIYICGVDVVADYKDNTGNVCNIIYL